MAFLPGWWYAHKALVGYLVLVLISIGGALLYQQHTVHILNQHDRQSCAQRNRLARNQRFVYDTLELLLIRALDENSGKAGGSEVFSERLATLEARLDDVGPENC